MRTRRLIIADLTSGEFGETVSRQNKIRVQTASITTHAIEAGPRASFFLFLFLFSIWMLRVVRIVKQLTSAQTSLMFPS